MTSPPPTRPDRPDGPGRTPATPASESLRRYATPRQAQYLDAIAAHGSHRRAAKALGINRTAIDRGIASLRKQAALKGWSPDHDLTHPLPDGYTLKGTSTLYDGDGNLVQQWVKTERDREEFEALCREVLEAMREEVPREKAVKPPKTTASELLNLYTLTDFHLGQMSWREETGADWDMKIAENLLVSWFSQAIAYSPDACVGVFAQLGDFLHFDGLNAVTPEHHNLLDADTRFAKLARIAIRVLRRIMWMLLAKHEHVHVIMCDANHDPVSAIWFREWFESLYSDEPRVTVDTSPRPYNAYEWGDTSLFFTHGHKKSAKQVHETFAALFRDIFGRTRYSYAHTGHLHNQAVFESPLMTVEQHRTLAAPDAFAARGGWMSKREASVITYHKDYGEVGRVVISPEMCGT